MVRKTESRKIRYYVVKHYVHAQFFTMYKFMDKENAKAAVKAWNDIHGDFDGDEAWYEEAEIELDDRNIEHLLNEIKERG